MVLFDDFTEQTIVATAVSGIGQGVHATGSLAWIATSYLLTTTVVQPIIGRLSVRPHHLIHPGRTHLMVP